ncbi:sugar O-acetyltransferase [Pseudomonas sp. AA-38]|uniref:sugar O-acetyltransferase n=1 Tax=Pseudomonas sp. AA-38 TaxID=3028807 RepID=UPI0023F7B4F9|nr:sugar O-acetyltransferase [Pseudomonas sp. AA-38]
MNEAEKAAAGLLYDANNDPELLAQRLRTKIKLFKLNATCPSERHSREAQLRGIIASIGEGFTIEGPFHCDYGHNIRIGRHFYANVNLVILDCASVNIGNNVFIAPNVGIYTAGHPLDVQRRNAGLEYAWPVTIGNDVWVGAGASILPGVTIGDGSVIGAGSVVNRSIPPGVLAAGNPCRVIRPITEADGRSPA